VKNRIKDFYLSLMCFLQIRQELRLGIAAIYLKLDSKKNVLTG